MKVEQFYNKNQFVMEGESTIIFQSYNSTIAIVNNGVLTLGYDWDYSRTTLKHLYLFLRDYKNIIARQNDITQYNIVRDLENAPNKKAFLQKAIDKNIIKVEEL